MFLMLLSTASDPPRSLRGGRRASGLLWIRSPMGFPWPALSWANTCEAFTQIQGVQQPVGGCVFRSHSVESGTISTYIGERASGGRRPHTTQGRKVWAGHRAPDACVGVGVLASFIFLAGWSCIAPPHHPPPSLLHLTNAIKTNALRFGTADPSCGRRCPAVSHDICKYLRM